VYQVIRECGGWFNWDVVVVEEYKAQNKNELHSRERYWIETLKPTLNKCVPTRTSQEYKKQYNAEHKDEINLRQKQYRNEHKDEIALKASVKVNCPCGGRYTVQQKSVHLKTKIHKSSLIKTSQNISAEPIQEPTPEIPEEPEEPFGGHSIIY
jgi:hypothetical protein